MHAATMLNQKKQRKFAEGFISMGAMVRILEFDSSQSFPF